MNFKTFYESKVRQFDIEILKGPYTNEDIPNKAYSEDVLYDIIIDDVRMQWNDTRKWCQAVDNSNFGLIGWKKHLDINEDNFIEMQDVIGDQVEKAIKSYNIKKHLTLQTKDTFGDIIDEL